MVPYSLRHEIAAASSGGPALGASVFFTHHGEKLRRLAKGFTNVTPDASRDTAIIKWPNGKNVF
jgi:hypothetical protein